MQRRNASDYLLTACVSLCAFQGSTTVSSRPTATPSFLCPAREFPKQPAAEPSRPFSDRLRVFYSYPEDVPVGYYTQVAGLGRSPSDVVFTGSKGVYCEEGEYAFQTGALDTFWRSAENFVSAQAICQYLGFLGMF